jgi:uncharacterized membrane protein YoaK (UPF0700 family)
MDIDVDTKKNLFILSLMTLTGISEAICFRRFGCFPNMMTGNTIRSMSFLADLEFGKALFHAALVGSYVAGGSLFKILDVTYTNKRNRLQQMDDDSKSTFLNSKSTLPLVAFVGLALFSLSDLVNKLIMATANSNANANNARAGLPILALGYGMINAATLNAVGAVTNAVTGHWTKVGLGVVDYLVAPKQQQQQQRGSKGLLLAPTMTSASCVAVFGLSVLCTGVVFHQIVARPALLARMPPFGTSFGLLYAVLLTWYSNTK